jgi:UDP-N-acetylglucosamine transferase subunit ALG13
MDPSPSLPLVLATVGTDHHPFDRLVSWMDAWAQERRGRARVIMQYGGSRPPVYAEGRAFLPPAELAALTREAVAVVTHGGPGSIVDATSAGLVPIVVPRRASLGEHVDDHQVRFAGRLGGAGLVRLARDAGELGMLLDGAVADPAALRRPAGDGDATEVAERFGALVDRLVRRPPREDGPRVLFIAGWGRSGSTLLDRMLGQLPDVVSVGELRDIWQRGVLEDRRCGCGEPFSSCPVWTDVGRRAFGGWDEVDVAGLHRLREHLDRPWNVPLIAAARAVPGLGGAVERYVDALERVYLAIHESTGARVIVDSSKIPTYAMLLRRIPGIDLRIVHLVRDPRGVVYSWQKRVVREDGGRRDQMVRYGTGSASVRYVLYNGLTHAVRAGLPYLLLRYEDLVRDPVTALGRVVRHAGLPDPAPLGFLGDGSVELAANHTVDGNPMRLVTGPIPVREDDEWRRRMDPGRRLMVSAFTSPLLARYGYRMRDGR